MPSAADIVTFDDPVPPPGASPWVSDGPSRMIEVVPPDPTWPDTYAAVERRIRDALGPRVLDVQHVGSTAVGGLWAKPVVDVDLVVADTDDEPGYVPALERAGFELRVREPWWHGHRMLRLDAPLVFLHVHGPDSPLPWQHRVLRDHLRADAADRELYAAAKRDASAAARAAGEHTMQYNARKERVVRDVYVRAFAAAGLTR